ncbi:short chain dehydrogenase [Karstenula rhodostoma CBS 690.94]|uniref:Short chain dehydrogenase n=1 Tax=Karstenula rhodostoma CBS 690.94 TaxID=1392251 RepID=A0A9P4P665_9PLEO|nr:short chain dehydrogenase [Karstenula rhodostoma CBS 690.94]
MSSSTLHSRISHCKQVMVQDVRIGDVSRPVRCRQKSQQSFLQRLPPTFLRLATMSAKDQLKYTNKLLNSRILIIGGSSGLGYGVAEATLEHGALVAISSSNSSRINASADKLKQSYPSYASNIHGLTVDLSNTDTLERELDSILKRATQTLGGKLDHVVFTAADALAPMKLADMTVDRIHKAGTIRWLAPLLLAKFLPTYLTASYRSSYTITTGGISEKPIPDWSVIASYAGGHHSMVRNLALELKPIRVNGVSPGVVDTELWTMGEEEKAGFFEQSRKRLFTGRVPTAGDVAESYLAIMKDWNMDASMVRSDGGSLFA